MLYQVFGNVLFDNTSSLMTETTFSNLIYILKMPKIQVRHRVSVLNVDESVEYIIPESDMPDDAISYTENYQQKKKKNITLKLINTDGKYTLNINNLWVDKRFRYDMGIQVGENNIIWFPKGIYIMGDTDLSVNNSSRDISIQLKDKFAIFEGNTGTLESAYEIPAGSTVEDVINGILNFDSGNGYILDYKALILDSSFKDFKTQTSIRKEEGENLGSILLELATQMSAECYYNNIGNLCYYPLNETINDDQKPVIWTYERMGRDLHNLSLNYKIDDIVNVVKVVGSNIDTGVYSAVVTNENPESPICIQRIGRRIGKKYSEANVWSDELAENLAKYYLRKSSIISVQFNCPVSFNPILNVNNTCEVENDFLNFKREKLLISSISFSSSDHIMNLSCVNTKDLPFIQ